MSAEASVPGPAIRPARPGDAALVLGFIRALADYERLAHEVKASEADIAALLFSDPPRAFCDIAEADGQPVGFAFWYYVISTFEGRCCLYLEDIYVKPEARGTGAGLALMRRLAERCRDEGLPSIEWQVLDWNAVALDFYERLGARPKANWLNRTLSGKALAALAGG
jgi:GNAT superfamily N-acetyltransferase